MLASEIPTSFPIPFANNAGVGYITTIPEASQIGITPGAASLYDGFPPVNFQPDASGGVPPRGVDFNGILNWTTASVRWLQAGGLAVYDSAFSTAIGGYPNGAVLISETGLGLWRSTADNNTTNPDTGGANWSPFGWQGMTTVSVTTADVTLTALQAANPIIYVTGALTADRNLIFPAVAGREWLVINLTTGSLNHLTVKTPAGTGYKFQYHGNSWGKYGRFYCDGTNLRPTDNLPIQDPATGFSRLTPNYCHYFGAPVLTTVTLGSTPAIAPPTSLTTAVVVRLNAYAYGRSGGVATDYARGIAAKTSAETSSLDQLMAYASGVEFSSTSALLGFDSVEGVIALQTPGSNFYINANGTAGSIVKYGIVGYYEGNGLG